MAETPKWSTSFQPPKEVEALREMQSLIQGELEKTVLQLDEALQVKARLEAKMRLRRGRQS